MATFEPYVKKIKPAMDTFLRNPTTKNVKKLEQQLRAFNWFQMKIFNVQILVPLVLKLEELEGSSQDIRSATIDCICFVTSKVYLKNVQGLSTTLVIVLKQIREPASASINPNISEELKLSVIQCIAESFKKSTSDILEQFYIPTSSMLLGQILLTLVEIIETEKYKKLIVAAIDCLMVTFYVYESADNLDIVLRSQVADTLFIYLPKIITVLFKISISDEKLGESLKIKAIQALGRILCVIYEETNIDVIRTKYEAKEFTKLIESITINDIEMETSPDDIFGPKKSKESFDERMKRIQGDGRSSKWFTSTSKRLRIIFAKMCILRSHTSQSIRKEYAIMCSLLLERCPHNLKENFIHLLESIASMAEDEDDSIRKICAKCLKNLQNNSNNDNIFDENAEILFDDHLTKLPRIIHRCDDSEQYGEFLFLKGFFRNLSNSKLQTLLSMPKNLEMFIMCLLSTLDLKTSHDLLNEEYSLREVNDNDFTECAKLHWRQFKYLNSQRCIKCVKEICAIFGNAKEINILIYDYLLDLLHVKDEAMNEIILLMLWMATEEPSDKNQRKTILYILLDELLNDEHWHLALKPDEVLRLKIQKPTQWFVDRTPGLYESAIEIRTQDCDSDDENDEETFSNNQRVTIIDAEFNVLHSCIVLDALGHIAIFVGGTFDKHIFRCLHQVLLKLANSNSIVYKAALFCLMCIQKSLKFAKISHLIETYTDYISYHLNNTLQRTPESKSAVEILTVVLQFSTRRAVSHFDKIFHTIRKECTKSYQSENIIAYLNIFNAFLTHVGQWNLNTENEIKSIPMQIEINDDDDFDLLTTWLNALNESNYVDDNIKLMSSELKTNSENINNSETRENDVDMEENGKEFEIKLPSHIEIIKDILIQVIKFISSSEQACQILSLECLISGVPLLKDYENELLPMVHAIWQPFIEKFRQRDAIVLNRCFTLLNVLATYSKDFILQRSLDDVIPFLNNFLYEASKHSVAENITAHTQEYKLQLKLIKGFSNLIQSMQIDNKHLNDILEVISLYLKDDQPNELQENAIEFYKSLRDYNGPFVYVVIVKKANIKEYKNNIQSIIYHFGIKYY